MPFLQVRSKRFRAEDRGFLSEAGQFPFGKPLCGVVSTFCRLCQRCVVCSVARVFIFLVGFVFVLLLLVLVFSGSGRDL